MKVKFPMTEIITYDVTNNDMIANKNIIIKVATYSINYLIEVFFMRGDI